MFFDECEIKVIFVTINIPQLLPPSKMLLCAPTSIFFQEANTALLTNSSFLFAMRAIFKEE